MLSKLNIRKAIELHINNFSTTPKSLQKFTNERVDVSIDTEKPDTQEAKEDADYESFGTNFVFKFLKKSLTTNNYKRCGKVTKGKGRKAIGRGL